MTTRESGGRALAQIRGNRRAAPVTANQPGEEEGLFRSGVERSDLRGLTGARPDRGGEAGLRQLIEPLLRLRHFLYVVGVERPTAVAGAVHHDLDRNDRPPRFDDGQGPRPRIQPTSRPFKRRTFRSKDAARAHERGAHSGRRALRAGVADRVQHVPNLCDRLLRREAAQRLLTGDAKGTPPGVRISDASGWPGLPGSGMDVEGFFDVRSSRMTKAR
jgi:hypothetical protein